MSKTTFQNFALLALRLTVAAIFLFAAYAKLSLWSAPPAKMGVTMLETLRIVSIIEPLGALALVFGLFTRYAAAALAAVMVGAIYILHFTMNVGFFTMPQKIGLDYNFLILSSCLALMAYGAGAWSADAKQG